MEHQTTSFYTRPFALDAEKEKYQKKRKLKIYIRFTIATILWLFILVYLISPLSKVKSIVYSGNTFFTNSELNEVLNIKSNKLILLLDKNKIQEQLKEETYINNVIVKKGLFSLKVEVDEIIPLYFYNNDLVLSSSQTINKDNYPFLHKISNLPTLKTEINLETKNLLVNNLNQVNNDLKEKMLEINITPINEEEASYYYSEILFYEPDLGYLQFTSELNYLHSKYAFDKYEQLIKNISNFMQENDIITSIESPLEIIYFLEDFDSILILE